MLAGALKVGVGPGRIASEGSSTCDTARDVLLRRMKDVRERAVTHENSRGWYAGVERELSKRTFGSLTKRGVDRTCVEAEGGQVYARTTTTIDDLRGAKGLMLETEVACAGAG